MSPLWLRRARRWPRTCALDNFKSVQAQRLQVHVIRPIFEEDLTSPSALSAVHLRDARKPELRASKSGSRVPLFSFFLLDFQALFAYTLNQWILLHFIHSLILFDLLPQLLVRIVTWLPRRYTGLPYPTDAKAAADNLAREISKQGFFSFQSVNLTCLATM